jgi:hypothetical protein
MLAALTVRTALATVRASWPWSGSVRARAVDSARAMRPAKRSSPRAPITSRISSAAARASRCAALVPLVVHAHVERTSC